MTKTRQYHVTTEGKGARAVAHYLLLAESKEEASERIQATEFELWLARDEDTPTGREGQAEPYRVTSVEAEQVAVVEVPIDPAAYPGLAGLTCQSARITVYNSAEDRTETAQWQDGRYAVVEAFNGRLRGGHVSGSPILTTDLSFGIEQGTFGQNAANGLLDDIVVMNWGPQALALPLANNAEGGSNTTVPTAGSGGNTAGASGDFFDAVTAGTILTFTNAQSAHGGLSYQFVQGGTFSAAHLEWTASMAAQATLWGRVYARFSSVAPSANINLIRWASGATTCASLRLTTTGLIQFANAAGTLAGTASAAISANTWYRIEYTITFSTTVGSGTANIYLLDALTTTTTASCTAQNLGATTAGTVRMGNVTSGGGINMTTWLDDMQVNATGFPGPVVSVPRLVMAPPVGAS